MHKNQKPPWSEARGTLLAPSSQRFLMGLVEGMNPRVHQHTSDITAFDTFDDPLLFLYHKKIGILGVGVDGPHIALILCSLDVEYEILECSSHNGGRHFTTCM